jgi:hypothetical protein
MHDVVMPIVSKYIEFYRQRGKERGKKLEALRHKFGDLTLPTPSAESLKRLGGKFVPGRFLILNGKREDAVEVLRAQFAKAYKSGLPLMYLGRSTSTKTLLEELALPESTAAAAVCPLDWWRNAAATLSQLDGALGAALKNGAILLLVEDIDSLLTELPDEPDAPALVRRAYAIKRLYHWCSENLVAGMVVDEGIYDNDGFYGGIAYADVERVEGKLVVDKEAL